MFTDLAPELKLGICKFLPPRALSRFSETSKELYELINLDSFCQRKFLHDLAVSTTLLERSERKKSDYKKIRNLTEIAIAQVKNRDFMGARRTFVLANKISESSHHRGNEEFHFEKSKSRRKSFKLHIIKIITTLIKAGDRECIIDPEVERSVSLEDYYFRAMIFKELARSSIEVGNATEANELFTLSKNTALLIKDTPDTSHKDLALKKIITAQVKAAITLTKTGRIAEANGLFVLSKELFLQVGSDSRELDFLNGVLRSASLGRRKCELLRKIATALAITGHEEDVDKFFTLAKEEVFLMQDDYSSKSLELAKIATALNEIGRKEQSDKSFTLSKDAALVMQRENDNALPLQRVVRHQLQAGNIEEAKATSLLIQGSRDLSRMLKKVVKAQIKATTAFAKAEQKGAADKFYQLQVDTIEQIKTINLSEDDFSHLSIMLKGIVKAQIKAATDLAKADQKEEADKFYQLQVDAIEEIKTILPKNLSEHEFKYFSTKLSKVLKKIVKAQLKAATDLAKADQKEEADKFFTLSKKTAFSIRRDYDRFLGLAKIATALVEIDQEESRTLYISLKKTAFSMGRSDYKPFNNYKTSLALTKLIPILAKMGLKEEIEELRILLENTKIPTIGSFSFESKALTKLAVALAKTGNTKKANQLFHASRYSASSIPWNIKSNASKKNVAAQTKIAIALAKSGNIAGVKDLIGNARKTDLSGIHIASIALKAAREININRTS